MKGINDEKALDMIRVWFGGDYQKFTTKEEEEILKNIEGHKKFSLYRKKFNRNVETEEFKENDGYLLFGSNLKILLNRKAIQTLFKPNSEEISGVCLYASIY